MTSKIEGIGVFAIRDIPKGIDPFKGIKKKKWHKFNISELKGIDQKVLKMIGGFFTVEDDNTVYIPEEGLNGINISFFLNDSKKPNLKIVEDGANEEISFVTREKIKKGKELTASYATYYEK
jgi:SET domain-containing protein